MQQYVIFNVLKEYCIPKEEEEYTGITGFQQSHTNINISIEGPESLDLENLSYIKSCTICHLCLIY